MKDSNHHAWLKVNPADEARWLDAADVDAFALWWMLQLWSGRTGGDAFIPKSKVAVATGRRLSPKRLETAFAWLVEEGQLIEHEATWEMTVWEQPAVEVWRDPVLRWRWARNNRLGKMSELCEFVKNRDRSLCRYCGVRVNWADKKGGTGATYDHIDPDQDNTRLNVCVACRRCNGIKRDRTPQQAGMPLYHPGTTQQQIAGGVAPMLAASATEAPVPEHRSRSDPNPTQIRSRSGAKSSRAHSRDRTDPDPTQIRTAPILRRTGGAIRVPIDSDGAFIFNKGEICDP